MESLEISRLEELKTLKKHNKFVILAFFKEWKRTRALIQKENMQLAAQENK